MITQNDIDNFKIRTTTEIADKNAKHSILKGSIKSLLDQLADFILSLTDTNGLIAVGEIILEGNNLTISPIVRWRINNVTYEKTDDTIFNIPFPSPGFKRIDSIIATVNGLLKITGTPSQGIALPPSLPVNTILISNVNVFEDEIETPFPDLTSFVTYEYLAANFYNKTQSDGKYGNVFTEGEGRQIITKETEFSGENLFLSELSITDREDENLVVVINAATGNIKVMSMSDFPIGGDGFEYIEFPQGGILDIEESMRKVVVTGDITVNALQAAPGKSGVLIIKQDDLGGHLIKLATNNIGPTIPLNTLPRAQTRLSWERYDDFVYWKAEVLYPGIEPTPVPVIRIDDFLNTFEILHSFNNEDILVSTENGEWLPYQGLMSIAPLDRPSGFWKAKVKEIEGRLESDIAISLPTYQIKSGFNYTLNFNLS